MTSEQDQLNKIDLLLNQSASSDGLLPTNDFPDSTNSHTASNETQINMPSDYVAKVGLQNRLRSNIAQLDDHTLKLYTTLLDASARGLEADAAHVLRRLTAKQASLLDFRSNQPFFGKTPLHCAATVGIARLLVKHGVSPNVRGSVRQTPLHTSTHASVAEFLLECGARLDLVTLDGSTALHWAVSNGCFPLVQVLVRAGIDINWQNHSGNTALHITNNLRIAEYLVTHGARPDVLNKNGKIPLESAAANGDDEESLRVASYLLDVSQNNAPGRSTKELVNKSQAGSPFYSIPERNLTQGGDSQGEVTVQFASSEMDSTHNREIKNELESVKTKIRRLNAKERWRMVRNTILRGELKAEEDPVPLKERRALWRHRLSSDIRFSENAKFASEWSDDEYYHSDDVIVRQEFFKTFFSLMLRDRPKLALKMLDRHRSFLYSRGTEKIYSYDLSLLGDLNDADACLSLLSRDENLEIISHEIVEWLLNIRWVLFTRESLIFEFLLHCFLLLCFLFTTLYGNSSMHDYVANLEPLISNPFRLVNWLGILPILCESLVAFLNLRYLLLYMIDVRLASNENYSFQSSHSVDSWWDLFPHICVLVEQVIKLGFGGEKDDAIARTSNTIAAVGAIKLWIQLLSFAEGFEVIGIAMCTIRRMIQDIMVYFVVLVVFIFGFSHAMALVFKASASDTFGSLSSSWIQLFFFVFNLDVQALNTEPDLYRRYWGYLFVAIYMVVVALVLLNLIVAVMTNACESIQKNAREQWLLQRAKLILRFACRDRSFNYLSEICHPCRSWFATNSSDQPSSVPPLPRKNIVTEQSDGKVLLEVPLEWLHTLNFVRRRSRHYSWLRTYLFRKWIMFSHSSSFVWPSIDDSMKYFQEQDQKEYAVFGQENSISGFRKHSGEGLNVLNEGVNESENAAVASNHMETSKLLETKKLAHSDLKESYGTTSEATEKLPNRSAYSSVYHSELRTGNTEVLTCIGHFFKVNDRKSRDWGNPISQTPRRLSKSFSTECKNGNEDISMTSFQNLSRYDTDNSPLYKPASSKMHGAESHWTKTENQEDHIISSHDLKERANESNKLLEKILSTIERLEKLQAGMIQQQDTKLS